MRRAEKQAVAVAEPDRPNSASDGRRRAFVLGDLRSRRRTAADGVRGEHVKSAFISLIYAGTLNGGPLQFLQAPLHGPHLLWRAWGDFVACFGMPRDLRRPMHRSLKHDHGKDIHTVATADGIVTIAPH